MGCQEVRSLLSEYLDGEISASEGGMVKDHLAECEDCARELEMLRGTAKLLLSVGEVEPPDGLLACIEAATIDRRTVRMRLRAALDPLFRLPVYARWTAASAAVAALVFAVVMHPGIRGPHVVKPGSPRVEIAAKQTSPPVTMKPAPRIEVAVTEEGSSPRRPHLRREIASSTAPARKIAAKLPAKAGVEENEPAAQPETESPATAPASESSSETVAKASATEEQPKPEIKLGKAVTKPDWQQKEADALADLRTKLAARNRQRALDARQSPIEEKQYSVNLASVKF